MRKALLSALILLGPGLSYANTSEVDFRCTAKSIESCEKKVVNELAGQGCNALEDSVRCREVTEDTAIYCSARTENCADATSDGFTGIDCRKGSKVKINDRQLSATWARSIFWIWVRDMCKF